VAEVLRDRINVARRFSQEHKCVVVLKGHRTLIAEPGGEIWVNVNGNPGMATGGTGDILTGMVAGFIAQNRSELLQAILASVHLHGLAGDVAREVKGEQCMVASDLVTAMPDAFRRAQQESSVKITRFW
jgi:NAD(P)H-hydrate epimerase